MNDIMRPLKVKGKQIFVSIIFKILLSQVFIVIYGNKAGYEQNDEQRLAAFFV